MKKLILTIVTMMFIGLLAFAYGSGKWTKENINENEIKSGKATRLNWPANLSLQKADLPPELKYDIRERSSRHINKEQLTGAKLISDIISDYPVNWITTYVSVEISATCGGKVLKAVSSNEMLSAEQKDIMNTSDMGTDVVIDVNYTYKVPVTNAIEKNKMHVAMTLVPEVEAEYVGGNEHMINYLKKNIVEFSKTTPEQSKQITIRFTVNEEGKVINANVSNASGYNEIHILLLDAIYQMPKWKPAENSKGVKVKQDFEFKVGQVGC